MDPGRSLLHPCAGACVSKSACHSGRSVPPVGAPPVGAPLPEAPAPFGVGSRTRGRSLPSTLASVGIPTYPWALAPELAPSSRGRSHRRAFLSLAFDTWAL